MQTVDPALEAVVTKVPEQYGHKEVQMSLLDQYTVAPEMHDGSMQTREGWESLTENAQFL